jgi:hypothetical protein
MIASNIIHVRIQGNVGGEGNLVSSMKRDGKSSTM